MIISAKKITNYKQNLQQIFMKKIFYLFVFMLLFITVACEQTLENEEINFLETNLQRDWTVNAYIDDILIFGPFTISTQTTPENESIIIKDNGNFWNFQTKAQVLNSSDAFNVKSSENQLSSLNAKVNILNGKVIDKDSIAFDIQFEDDETPYGITYTLKGKGK